LVGSYDYERVGGSVSGCPDLDGDGVPDFAFADGHGIDLYSGRTRGFLRQLNPSILLHWQFMPFPDLDGDTVPDFVCANPSPDQAGGSSEAGVVISVDGSHANTIAMRYGTSRDDQVGAAVAVLADVDGDGWRDVLVGNLADSGVSFKHAGEVRLLSGRDGSVLRVHDGTTIADWYGSAITTVPDLDGDGTPDYAIASSHVLRMAPCVDVRSGATGSQLLTLPMPFGGSSYPLLSLAAGRDSGGRVVLALGDGDICSVALFDLKTGSQISTLTGESQSGFGTSVSALGDVDGDQVSDWIVGAPTSSHSASLAGSAVIVSGASGNELGRFDGTPGDSVGTSVAAIDDLDGDGILDALVGVPNAGTAKHGAVVAISGASAAPLLAYSGSEYNERVGSTVAALGDVNRDGVADFATTRIGGDEVLVVSGATRGLLARIQPANPGGLGKAIATLTGDFTSGVDPDGIPDLLAGDPTAGPGGGAWLIRLDDLMLQASPPTVFGGHPIELDTRGGPPGNLVALVLTAFDATPLFVPAALGNFGGDGIWTVSATAPTGLAGHNATLRSFTVGFKGSIVDSSDVMVTFD
jgi:hypothetical protein